MKRSKEAPKYTTNVIVDCRSAAKDRVVPVQIAKKLYEEGKLMWDLTNGGYTTPENGRCITELLIYPQRG